ncbi:hypothetical protein [Acetomicrobium hydrogeniformans]|uniref:hypothetical protein n=1 Tax=Acetomicrobium hydrogeniformans TaxID=649746 RepID=UPI002355FB9C|nr:hypothetical protein [Acetomicrobium hydrogeniformans]
MADESVVVMKSRPVKAGNRLEGKTGMTCGTVRRSHERSKCLMVAKGGSVYQAFPKRGGTTGLEHKPSDGTGHDKSGTP